MWACTIIIISHRKPALGSKSPQYFCCSSPIARVPLVSTFSGNGGRLPHLYRPAPCQGLHPQVHKTLQVSPEGYTISGRHSAHVANSAPSILKLYCNGRIHFAQNFKTWSTISCAIFGKHTNTDIFFDCYFFKITIIFSSCKAINPASNPQP